MESVKVALIAESFLPSTNGVVNSLLRVIDHLTERGDEALVIAPATHAPGPSHYRDTPVARVSAVGWPGYPDVRVSLGGKARLTSILDDFRPDVAHLASPFLLGWSALRACEDLGIPTVAVYQTEVPSYAGRYNAAWGESMLWARVRAIHQRADVTLAPSTFAMDQLTALGVERLHLWPRGVDTARFKPRHRSDDLRSTLAPHGEVIVGYVGRLAVEKRVEDLAALANVPGIRLVIVGDGPERARLQRRLPHALFTGFLGGTDLASTIASMDVLVHTGELETFCQVIQEALASGVPAVAPRRGGPVDLIEHGVTGALYAPGNLAEMSGYVQMLAAKREVRERWSLAARTSVEHRTWPRVCEALTSHYVNTIERRHAPLSTLLEAVPA